MRIFLQQMLLLRGCPMSMPCNAQALDSGRGRGLLLILSAVVFLVFALGGGPSHAADDLLSGEDELLVGDDSLLSGNSDELLLDEGDSLLDGAGEQEDAADTSASADMVDKMDGDTVHEALFLENRYPSAGSCGTCHPRQYREWSVSPHAYAQISPVFNAMQKTVNAVTNGTNGDFCIRCHSPVGMNIGESTYMSNFDRHPASREGITCIACHRVNKAYGKISGRVSLVEGDLLQPIYGPEGNKELERVLDNRDVYRVVTSPDEQGRRIHTRAEKFFALTKPGFCGMCHDVNLVNGFRLEEAFSEYKHSPAAKDGVSCQDCHMGKVPGVNGGYETGPAATVGGADTLPRRITNHMIAGPDYSVVHPGIFPHNAVAAELATLQEWITFDYRAGWGTDEFEDNVSEEYVFPPRWTAIDDRYDAREIIEEQLALLAEYREQGTQVLKAGYQLGELVVERADGNALNFKVQVKNATDGHNVPTGFIAERLVFLRVTVMDGDGMVVFRSGDTDPNGDVRDSHSTYVHNGELPVDDQLFSLQSLFLTRMVRGGEREQILPINYSPDPLPYIRPPEFSSILTGAPRGARIHRVGIEPLGTRWAKYRLDAEHLAGTSGPYQVKVELVAGMIPINLVNVIKDVGFEYDMSAREIAAGVVAGHRVLWEKTLSIPAKMAALQ